MSTPRNRAQWLALIKAHGHESGGILALAKTANTFPQKVKEAVDPLVLAGYVTMTGKRGRGGGFKYTLTSLGHRYVNEHSDELTEEAPTPPPKVAEAPKTFPVPEGPKQSNFIEPFAGAHEPASSVMEPPVHEPKPAVNPLPTRPSDTSNMRIALGELLYDRFGDEVTAKQLIEYMGGGGRS